MNCNNLRSFQKSSINCGCQRNSAAQPGSPSCSVSCSCPFQNFSRAQLMQYINQVSFAVDDILLYLDTHPDDQDALSFYHDNAVKRAEALRYYSAQYGPLTVDAAQDNASRSWEWIEQPWPWEGGCY